MGQLFLTWLQRARMNCPQEVSPGNAGLSAEIKVFRGFGQQPEA